MRPLEVDLFIRAFEKVQSGDDDGDRPYLNREDDGLFCFGNESHSHGPIEFSSPPSGNMNPMRWTKVACCEGKPMLCFSESGNR